MNTDDGNTFVTPVNQIPTPICDAAVIELGFSKYLIIEDGHKLEHSLTLANARIAEMELKLGSALNSVKEFESDRDSRGWLPDALLESAVQNLTSALTSDGSALLKELEKLRRENQEIKKSLIIPVWRDGCPDKTHGTEWFIAKLDNGEKVVLRALPEEWSYDYKTADDTYYKASRVRQWMQFKDSEFIDVSTKG